MSEDNAGFVETNRFNDYSGKSRMPEQANLILLSETVKICRVNNFAVFQQCSESNG
jgi:hypothetical protein